MQYLCSLWDLKLHIIENICAETCNMFPPYLYIVVITGYPTQNNGIYCLFYIYTIASSFCHCSPTLPTLSPHLCSAHFGRFMWLGLYSDTRLSENPPPPTYTAGSTILFLQIGAVTLLRMCIEWTNSFVRISADLSGSGYTSIHDWVIISPTYTAVSKILFLPNGAVTLLRMCIEWTNSFGAYFGRFIWLRLYIDTRLSVNLPHLYSSF